MNKNSKETVYITSPIYYVNDKPHIGHAYTTLACDVIARWKRMYGKDVYFMTGTDEYGQKMQQSAVKANMDPKKFADKLSKNFLNLCSVMNFSQDTFIRTTDKKHEKAVQHLWYEMETKGSLYKGSYKGWYSIRDEAYVDESELTKSKDGKRLAPSGSEVSWMEQPSYFFKLSAFQDKLLNYYEENPDFILPKTRRNEVISFVKSGLKDISVSRVNFNWGVAIKNDPDHVMYVWLDALTSYITACGYPSTTHEKSKYWPASIQIIGKDILRFHAVYWPAILMAANLPLPKRVFAHGWWTNEGKKISKSLGNVIDPIPLQQQYGVDQIRYYLLREMPFGQDGDFSKENLKTRINNELANDYGNLCQRLLSFIDKKFDGVIPVPESLNDEGEKIMKSLKELVTKTNNYIDTLDFYKALETIFREISFGNRYFTKSEPWKTFSQDIDKTKHTLFLCCELVRHVTYCLFPFIPTSCIKILRQLGYSSSDLSILDLDKSIAKHQKIGDIKIVFPKIISEKY